jgi:hypothetical protein
MKSFPSGNTAPSKKPSLPILSEEKVMKKLMTIQRGLKKAGLLFLIFFAVLVLHPGTLCAQTEEDQELITDRPDQTESPSIVPTGSVQLETGILFMQDEFSEAGTDFEIETLHLASTLIRIGVTPVLEFRIGGGYTQEKIISQQMESRHSGMGGVSAGAKIKLTEEKGWLPESAFLVNLDLPVGQEHFKPSEVQPTLLPAAAHTFSETLSLGYNLGGSWDLDTQDAIFLYSAALGTSITDRYSMFFELFGGFSSETDSPHSFDLGGTYLLKPNLQFDGAIGYGLNDAAEDWFLLAGLTIRFPH